MRAWLVLLLMCSAVQAEPIRGYSLLGMCHPRWDCRATQTLLRGQNPLVLRWLELTFGTRCSCVNRLLRDPREKIVAVHLTNGPCLRNGRCGPYEVFAGETIRSADRKVRRGNRRLLRKYERVVRRLRGRLNRAVNVVGCYVSPMLESDLSNQARRKLLALAAPVFPECQLVDNPHRKRCIAGTICEVHGDRVRNVEPPCIADLDGSDGKEVDLKKWVRETRACALQFYWELFMNCLPADFARRFPDPRQRDCRGQVVDKQRVRNKLCKSFLPQC